VAWCLGTSLTRHRPNSGRGTRGTDWPPVILSSRDLFPSTPTQSPPGVRQFSALHLPRDGCPKSHGVRDLGGIRGCTDSWNVQKMKLLDLAALPRGTRSSEQQVPSASSGQALRLRVRPPQTTRRKSKGADAPLRMTILIRAAIGTTETGC
jgi:hypothetical protein